jgi:hypothetical protein
VKKRFDFDGPVSFTARQNWSRIATPIDGCSDCEINITPFLQQGIIPLAPYHCLAIAPKIFNPAVNKFNPGVVNKPVAQHV